MLNDASKHEQTIAQLQAQLAHERSLRLAEQQLRLAAEEKLSFTEAQLDGLRKSYVILQQELERLRRRIFEAKAERVDSKQLELEFERTKAALDEVQKKIAEASESLPELPAKSKPKSKPTGRRDLDATAMPVEVLQIKDPAMEELVSRGEATVIGADESSQLKRRRGCMIRLVVQRLTYQLANHGESTLVTAVAPPSIIERSIGTPSLFAHIATEKHERASTLFRIEERFQHEGIAVDRGTMSRWMNELGGVLGATILHAMKEDAFRSAMCLSTDATGILVQRERDPTSSARAPCKKGHYFVQIADRDHVFFEYCERETSEAVREMFRGFSGYVQADAKNVFDVLFREPIHEDEACLEVGCWAHARRYFFDAAAIAKEASARELLYRIQRIFEIDSRFWAKNIAPSKRKALRLQFLKPEIELFFDEVEKHHAQVRDRRGLMRSALGYVTRQREALMRFLEDGRLKLDNNSSERALRKVAIGRKNWLFVGSDDHAQTTANLLSMLASAKLHELDPEEYLRDVFRVLPHWPKERHLELAPKYWASTRAKLNPKELEAELGPLTIPN